MAINQQITALPDAPNRLDRDNFATDMHAFFVGMQAMTVELETFRGEANTTATGVNTDATAAVTARTAAQTAQTAAETAQTAAENASNVSMWSYVTSYDADNVDTVAGGDGQSYRSLTNSNAGKCPHEYNQITRVGALNHYKAETVTVADPSGKTYTLKVKMWRETLSGDISLVIEEGSGDFEIMAYDHKVVTQTIAEYSTTATFPAGSDANVRVRINPDDNDGPDGDTFGVYAVFLYDHADPDTNLLTGDSRWQRDLTGWDTTNCTISSVAASTQNWVKISGGNEIPVGGVYIDADTDANPLLKIGYGTWVSLGAGRVLVGIDSGDSDFDTMGETGGEKEVTLNDHQLPPKWYPDANNLIGGFTQGTTSRFLTNSRTASGQGLAHNNVQPYLIVAIWKRTA